MAKTWPTKAQRDQQRPTEVRQGETERALRRSVADLVRLYVRRGHTTASALDAVRAICEDALERSGR